MQAAVTVTVGVGLVTRVDDGTLHHGIEANLGLKEIGALRDLIGAVLGAIFRTHLAGAAEELPRHQERGELLDDLAERHVAVHEVILVAGIAIALAIAVVLVDQNALSGGQQGLSATATYLQNTLASLL